VAVQICLTFGLAAKAIAWHAFWVWKSSLSSAPHIQAGRSVGCDGFGTCEQAHAHIQAGLARTTHAGLWDAMFWAHANRHMHTCSRIEDL